MSTMLRKDKKVITGHDARQINMESPSLDNWRGGDVGGGDDERSNKRVQGTNSVKSTGKVRASLRLSS